VDEEEAHPRSKKTFSVFFTKKEPTVQFYVDLICKIKNKNKKKFKEIKRKKKKTNIKSIFAQLIRPV